MLLGGLVDRGAARAVIAILTVLAAVGAGKENVVQQEFDHADSSGSIGSCATTIGTFWGLLDGNHGTSLFLAWSQEYTRKCQRSKSRRVKEGYDGRLRW